MSLDRLVEAQVQPGSLTRLLLCVAFLGYLSVALLLDPAHVPFGLLWVALGIFLLYREYRAYRQRTDGPPA